MNTSKKIISILLLANFLSIPCLTSTDKNKHDFFSRHRTKLIVGGTIAASTITLGALACYQIRRNREASAADIHSFGNEFGQPVISSHGFGAFWGEVVPYMKSFSRSGNYIFDGTAHHLTVFNYPDAVIGFNRYRNRINKCREKSFDPCGVSVKSIKTIGFLEKALRFKFDQVSLGQTNDLTRINKAAKTVKNRNTLGFGVSRGAATFINFMGTTPNKKIKAIVLDSPFASLEETLKHRMSAWYFLFAGKIPGLARLTYKLLPLVFPRYDINGLQPIDTVDKIDPKIPIIFLHSKKDKVVPVSGSRKLYIKRKKQGCNNVYLVELSSGKHAKALHGPEGEKFQNAVHAFYKRYGYPYNPKFANQIDLDDYQPSIAEVEARLNP